MERRGGTTGGMVGSVEKRVRMRVPVIAGGRCDRSFGCEVWRWMVGSNRRR
jgi:hypothetical protein